MPESKNRRAHHHHQQNHPAPHHNNPKKLSRPALIGIIFFALLGLGIGYFISGANLYALVIGGAAGAVIGYLFGHQVDKGLRKK